MKEKQKKTIAAGEIRQWCYCPRQWYLLKTTRMRVMTPASQRGRRFHQKEAGKFGAVIRWQYAVIAMFIGGAACYLWLS